MPEPDTSTTAAYLSKVAGDVTLNIYGVGSEPKHIPAPAGLVNRPNDLQLWAEEELTERGVYVKEWTTPEGWDGWDGEFDYKATVGTLPPLPAEGKVWVTCTAVTYGPAIDDLADGPVEEHGWIQPGWKETELYENRDDVAPMYRGTNPDEAAKCIRDYLGSVSDVEQGRGTFYAADARQDPTSPTAYHYACHAEDWTPEQLARIEQQVQAPARGLGDGDAQVHPVFNPHQQASLTVPHAQAHR